jgi:thiamine pyrophosphokinase
MLDVRYNQQLSPAALIILNTPIMNNDPMNDEGTLTGALKILWQKTSYRVCADGGANRLFDATVTNNSSSDETISKYLPDLITGDLDSLLPHVREYYEKNGVPIVRVEDQDYHDLDVSFELSA